MTTPFGVTLKSSVKPRGEAWAAAIEAGVRNAVTSMGESMREFVDRRFEESRDPWGQPWRAHSPVTLEIRVSLARSTAARSADRELRAAAHANGGEITRGMLRRAGRRINAAARRAQARAQGAKLLVDKGMLRGSITSELRDGGRRVVVFVGGAAAAYAGVHQWGNPDNEVFGRARGPVPARPFLPLRGPADAPVADPPPELLDELRGTIRDAVKLALQRANASFGSVRLRGWRR